MENPRRQFLLSSREEAKYLDGLGLPWETVKINNQQWVFIHNWPVPPGYNLSTVTLGLIIPASYPDVQIDMFFVSPTLERQNKQPIKALSTLILGNENWQQWSRHRTAAKPWRAGEDDLATHLSLVTNCLDREIS